MKEKNLAPIVLDCEASGLARESYPIEIGYVLPDGEKVSYYIKPEPEWTFWDPESEKIHNIKREFLEENGLPAYEVAQKLNSQLTGFDVYSDCEEYENMWLNTLFKTVKMERYFKCKAIQDLFIQSGNYWQFDPFYSIKKDLFNQPGITRHKAGDDAWVIQQAFVRSRNQVLSLNAQRLKR